MRKVDEKQENKLQRPNVCSCSRLSPSIKLTSFLSPGLILIQILIQIGCIYTEANWIRIQTQTTSPMWAVIQIRIRIQDLVLMLMRL